MRNCVTTHKELCHCKHHVEDSINKKMIAQNTSSLRQYVYRLLRPRTLDFRLATNQLLELCFSPSRVYRLAKNRNCMLLMMMIIV
jgi:hypothetical protein